MIYVRMHLPFKNKQKKAGLRTPWTMPLGVTVDEGSREELRTIYNYFNERRGRMQYAELKRRGLPIGSGHVEAVNKTHVEERMKRSGMRWSMAGDQAILGTRSLIRSGRFDRSWEYIVKELNRRKPANDNWNPWKEKKKAA